LEAPRREVPAGSVGVAGRQTGIYPGASPGGWRLIGRTPLVIADPREGFFPVGPGDRLRFEAIDSREYEARRGERLGGAGTGTGPV
jgi:allophanate hydrolase subunit 1